MLALHLHLHWGCGPSLCPRGLSDLPPALGSRPQVGASQPPGFFLPRLVVVLADLESGTWVLFCALPIPTPPQGGDCLSQTRPGLSEGHGGRWAYKSQWPSAEQPPPTTDPFEEARR